MRVTQVVSFDPIVSRSRRSQWVRYRQLDPLFGKRVLLEPK